MSKPFDAASKQLLETDPTSWLIYAGFTPNGPVTVIDADLSTVTAEADKVFLVEASEPWIAHLEIQASRDVSLPERMLRYHVLLRSRHKMPVRSVAILLRSQADGMELSGRLTIGFPEEPPTLEFGYRVVRTWQQPVEIFLEGGRGTLPLAPLAKVTESEIPEILWRVNDRLRREFPTEEGDILWSATSILLGLRFSKARVSELLEGGRGMGIHGLEESTTYTAVMDALRARFEGREQGREEERVANRRDFLRRTQLALLRNGQLVFGEPTPYIVATIESIDDLERLDMLGYLLLKVSSWDELMANTSA